MSSISAPISDPFLTSLSDLLMGAPYAAQVPWFRVLGFFWISGAPMWLPRSSLRRPKVEHEFMFLFVFTTTTSSINAGCVVILGTVVKNNKNEVRGPKHPRLQISLFVLKLFQV